jgi:hypothetical protein
MRNYLFDVTQLKSLIAAYYDLSSVHDVPIRRTARDIGIDESTLRRAFEDKPITEKKAKLICDFLKVKIHELRLASLCDYALVGISPMEPLDAPSTSPFQDFNPNETGNCVTSYMWTNPNGSRLSYDIATVRDGGVDTNALRVTFSNPHGDPPNISIHPQGLRARKRTREQRFLGFKTRLLTPTINNSPQVAIAVRVGDRRCQQWEYRQQSTYFLFIVSDNKDSPAQCYLPLHSIDRWTKFYSAGHVRGIKPDFSAITTVVFEFGRIRQHQRPAPCADPVTLDIWDLRFYPDEHRTP